MVRKENRKFSYGSIESKKMRCYFKDVSTKYEFISDKWRKFNRFLRDYRIIETTGSFHM